MGITVDFHPPVDVRQPYGHDVIGDRALGHEPRQVAALGRAILEGLQRGGVAGCIKHMPGHGRTTTDTHHAMPTVTASVEELEVDLAPFRSLNRAPIGMTGHLLFTEWDAAQPATFSATIIEQVIRGAIGFEGLLLTDDIDMQALEGTIPERAARAHKAGCDIILNCWAKLDDMAEICESLPSMSAMTSTRLDKALADTCVRSDTGQQAELLAKRDALLALVEEAA